MTPKLQEFSEKNSLIMHHLLKVVFGFKEFNFLFITYLILSFVLPLHQKLAALAVVLLVVAWAVQLFTNKIHNIKFHFNIISSLFVAYYALHMISIIWTDNIRFALFDLIIKFSFFIIPLIISINSFPIKEKEIEHILKAFLYGNLLAVIISLLQSTINYIIFNEPSTIFFYTNFAIYHHPAYMGMYLNFGLLIVIYLYEQKKLSPKLAFICASLFLISIVLTLARIAFFTALLLVFSYFFWLLYKYKFKQIIIIIISITAIIGLLYLASLRFERFQLQHYLILNSNKGEMPIYKDTRFFTFAAGFGVFKENWLLGCGIGDIHTELKKQYQKLNFEKGIQKKLNVHNQFLQAAALLGIFGLSILFCIFLLMIFKSIKKKQPLLLGLTLIIFLASLTESILERQSGIIFTAFFFNLLSQQYLFDRKN